MMNKLTKTERLEIVVIAVWYMPYMTTGSTFDLPTQYNIYVVNDGYHNLFCSIAKSSMAS